MTVVSRPPMACSSATVVRLHRAGFALGRPSAGGLFFLRTAIDESHASHGDARDASSALALMGVLS